MSSQLVLRHPPRPSLLAALLQLLEPLEGHISALDLQEQRLTIEFDCRQWSTQARRLLETHGHYVEASGVTDSSGDWPRLSAREAQVIRLFATGLTLKEVAAEMGVSTHSAREYWSRVRQKWQVRSMCQATAIMAGRRPA